MVTVEEGKGLTQEIIELLQAASKDEKLQIKGILIGANLTKIAKEEKSNQLEIG